MTAAEFLRANPIIATSLSAREIAEFIPAAIRQQSFFSARTIFAHHLAETHKDIVELLEGKINHVEVRARMKHRLDMIGYAPEPGKEGTLQDLSSDLRTNLIIDMQEQRCRGYAVWRSQQDPSKLLVWPANELYRALERSVPRDWKLRWNQARADLGEGNTSATYALTPDGPFVALKNDSIWVEISRFGTPWPPFDYQSGMRLRQVLASHARDLGVLGKTRPSPAKDPMRRVERASCEGMPPAIIEEWVRPYGIRAVVADGSVHISPDASVIEEIISAAKEKTTKAQAVIGFITRLAKAQIDALLPDNPLQNATAISIDADALRHIEKNHGPGNETRQDQREIEDDDIRLLPELLQQQGVWRLAKNATRRGDLIEFISHITQTYTLWSISRSKKTPRLALVTMWAKKMPVGRGSRNLVAPDQTPETNPRYDIPPATQESSR